MEKISLPSELLEKLLRLRRLSLDRAKKSQREILLEERVEAENDLEPKIYMGEDLSDG